MSDQEPDNAHLTKSERELVQKIAERDGVTLDQAATKLGQRALARIVKRRTGKTPAKVYSIRKPK